MKTKYKKIYIPQDTYEQFYETEVNFSDDRRMAMFFFGTCPFCKNSGFGIDICEFWYACMRCPRHGSIKFLKYDAQDFRDLEKKEKL